mmetsp:Transcript_94456/g.209834  ORF Transcript_94456/g.209834 Transcript_94456/m.209834 type:complete len:219 (+) Transcript_94456:186-842(+)
MPTSAYTSRLAGKKFGRSLSSLADLSTSSKLFTIWREGASSLSFLAFFLALPPFFAFPWARDVASTPASADSESFLLGREDATTSPASSSSPTAWAPPPRPASFSLSTSSSLSSISCSSAAVRADGAAAAPTSSRGGRWRREAARPEVESPRRGPATNPELAKATRRRATPRLRVAKAEKPRRPLRHWRRRGRTARDSADGAIARPACAPSMNGALRA